MNLALRCIASQRFLGVLSLFGLLSRSPFLPRACSGKGCNFYGAQRNDSRALPHNVKVHAARSGIGKPSHLAEGTAWPSHQRATFG